MINSIKRYLNIILEGVSIGTPILINPSLSEIKKLFREVRREYPAIPDIRLRFVLELSSGNYYIASGKDYVHSNIETEFKLDNSCVEGGIYSNGYLWFRKDNLLKDNILEDPIELFKETNIYKVVEPIVDEIEYE